VLALGLQTTPRQWAWSGSHDQLKKISICEISEARHWTFMCWLVLRITIVCVCMTDYPQRR